MRVCVDNAHQSFHARITLNIYILPTPVRAMLSERIIRKRRSLCQQTSNRAPCPLLPLWVKSGPHALTCAESALSPKADISREALACLLCANSGHSRLGFRAGDVGIWRLWQRSAVGGMGYQK